MKKKKLKICFMGDARPQDVHTPLWAKSFAELGHEVHVISPYNAEIKGVKVHATKTKYNKYFNFFLSYFIIRRLIKKIKPDMINAHYLGTFTFLGVLSGFHPFMGTVWGSDVALFSQINPITNFMFRYILKKSDLIQVPDKATTDYLNKKYNASKKKLFLQYWGTNPEKFKPVKKRKKIQILYLRKCTYKYSTEVFINALSLVKKKFPKFTATMIKGKDFTDMRRLINKYKLNNNIKILEWIDHEKVLGLLNSSLIYVDSFQRSLPGSNFGVTVAEAMACELPVVLADNPGVNEYMKHNYDVLFYKRGDYKELAECIIKLLKNKQLREKLGKNARKTAVDKLNWNKNKFKIEKKYIELVEKYRQKRQGC